MRASLFCLLTLALVSANAESIDPDHFEPSSAVAVAIPEPVLDRYAAAWQEPARITLPEPERSVLLRRGVDAQAWIKASGIAEAKTLPMGQARLVQFRMSDEAWAANESRLCGSAQVSRCETAVCQSIQLDGEVLGSNEPKARIVPKAETAPQRDPEGSVESACRTPLAALPPDGASPGINLDLDFRGASTSEPRRSAGVSPGGQNPAGASVEQSVPTADGETAPSLETSTEAPEAATESAATAGEREVASARAAQALKLPFQLAVSQPFTGQAGFSAAELPADTSDYDLLVGEGCRQVRVPLDAVSPAHVPMLISALVEEAEVDNVAADFGLSIVSQHKLEASGEYLVVFLTRGDLLAVAAQLRVDARVASAQREFIYTTAAEARYSDPYAFLSYGPGHTGAQSLHTSTKGATQTVAVIDTGVDVNHPELVGRVEQLDLTDGKGWAAEAHGTAVAGIIAAAADNAQGGFGVAPDTQILALKACYAAEEGALAAKCRSSSLVRALDAAITRDAQIINMSLAGPHDPLVEKYVALATGQNRLLIAGAGNGGPSAKPAFPAAYPKVLAVTAVDADNALYGQANRGDYIDLAAPGVDIVAPDTLGGYPTSSGTSWAAAHVAGVAALIRDLVPLMSAGDIAALLNSSAKDLGSAGADPEFGGGLVDACRAAALATADAVGCPEADAEATTIGGR